jgi:hypothetical protein
VAALAEHEGWCPIVAFAKGAQHLLCANGVVEVDVDEHAAQQGIGADRSGSIGCRTREGHLETIHLQLFDEGFTRTCKRGSGRDIAVDNENAER